MEGRFGGPDAFSKNMRIPDRAGVTEMGTKGACTWVFARMRFFREKNYFNREPVPQNHPSGRWNTTQSVKPAGEASVPRRETCLGREQVRAGPSWSKPPWTLAWAKNEGGDPKLPLVPQRAVCATGEQREATGRPWCPAGAGAEVGCPGGALLPAVGPGGSCVRMRGGVPVS